MHELKPITCRAAICHEEGTPLIVEDVVIDPPTGDQVRVKMVSAGICASDAHFVWGTMKVTEWDGHNVPMVLGHEGAGIVESVGDKVTGVEVGDHVLTTFMPMCKNCHYCANPLTNVCALENLLVLGAIPNKKFPDGRTIQGLAGLGVYSEYVNVKQSQVVKINKDVNLQNAAIISCAVATGFYSATCAGAVKPDTTAAIWGMGAIGLNAVFGCKYAGAKNIIGVDINSDKRAVAEEFGVTEFINPKDLDKPVEQYLLEKYGGADYAFECIGHQAVLNTALKSLSVFGTLVMVGVAPKGTEVIYPTADLLMGRKIVGAFMGNKPSDQAYQELADMYKAGTYHIDRLVTNKFKLDEINEAFQLLKDGKCIRSLILFDS